MEEWIDIFEEGMEELDKKLEKYGIDIVAKAITPKNFYVFDTCGFRSIERRAIEKVETVEKELGKKVIFRSIERRAIEKVETEEKELGKKVICEAHVDNGVWAELVETEEDDKFIVIFDESDSDNYEEVLEATRGHWFETAESAIKWCEKEGYIAASDILRRWTPANAETYKSEDSQALIGMGYDPDVIFWLIAEGKDLKLEMENHITFLNGRDDA